MQRIQGCTMDIFDDFLELLDLDLDALTEKTIDLVLEDLANDADDLEEDPQE